MPTANRQGHLEGATDHGPHAEDVDLIVVAAIVGALRLACRRREPHRWITTCSCDPLMVPVMEPIVRESKNASACASWSTAPVRPCAAGTCEPGNLQVLS
jgi:hypothetical protein